MKTWCTRNVFPEVLTDRHTSLVQGYLECARHALSSSSTSTFFWAPGDHHVIMLQCLAVIIKLLVYRRAERVDNASAFVRQVKMQTYHGLCPGAEKHPGDHLLGREKPISFAGRCPRSAGIPVLCLYTTPAPS